MSKQLNNFNNTPHNNFLETLSRSDALHGPSPHTLLHSVMHRSRWYFKSHLNLMQEVSDTGSFWYFTTEFRRTLNVLCRLFIFWKCIVGSGGSVPTSRSRRPVSLSQLSSVHLANELRKRRSHATIIKRQICCSDVVLYLFVTFQQAILIAQLQEQHYQQYMQLYQQQMQQQQQVYCFVSNRSHVTRACRSRCAATPMLHAGEMALLILAWSFH